MYPCLSDSNRINWLPFTNSIAVSLILRTIRFIPRSDMYIRRRNSGETRRENKDDFIKTLTIVHGSGKQIDLYRMWHFISYTNTSSDIYYVRTSIVIDDLYVKLLYTHYSNGDRKRVQLKRIKSPFFQGRPFYFLMS